MKDKILSVSIFTLALSIFISAILIAKAIENNGFSISSGINSGANSINNAIDTNFYENEEKSNINFQETAVYLGISESELMTLVNDKELMIPHIKIEGRYIFNKESLDKWIGESR